MIDDIQPTVPEEMDEEFEEGWHRLTDEPDLRGVEAYRSDDEDLPWQVTACVAEFLREEPLEGELRASMATALRAVPGVSDVAQEDREVWLEPGRPSGRDLVAAAARVVDSLADRARREVRGE